MRNFNMEISPRLHLNYKYNKTSFKCCKGLWRLNIHTWNHRSRNARSSITRNSNFLTNLTHSLKFLWNLLLSACMTCTFNLLWITLIKFPYYVTQLPWSRFGQGCKLVFLEIRSWVIWVCPTLWPTSGICCQGHDPCEFVPAGNSYCHIHVCIMTNQN